MAARKWAQLHGVSVEVPVVPDRETAHGWLVEELARPEYAQDPSVLMRLLTWLARIFDEIGTVDVSPWRLAVIVAVVLVVVVAIALYVAGPARLRRHAATSSAVVHDDDTRTAAQMRAAADAAAAREDWPLAVIERFRAVVRGLEERVVLDERPGRTAREAAQTAGSRLPGLSTELHDAAGRFDGVCYGHLPAGPADDAALRALDDQVAAARPTAPAPPVREGVQ
ncbi:DUF4129 domain-containing protein [Isoptericola sp. S6320L]|uniref:DUF4129 domain-containing protein n=1 Tax=Isoptericola sp. S6320L TaxID=2926411 RepID=UPI001FF500EF|nr:DUF4129 domain-containing protein [Isoptericola sp. S6320L]MCK0118701.1 DUF4129 domain-containing protein [Isoptericola sp. S6320L]